MPSRCDLRVSEVRSEASNGGCRGEAEGCVLAYLEQGRCRKELSWFEHGCLGTDSSVQ